MKTRTTVSRADTMKALAQISPFKEDLEGMTYEQGMETIHKRTGIRLTRNAVKDCFDALGVRNSRLVAQTRHRDHLHELEVGLQELTERVRKLEIDVFERTFDP